MRGRDFRRDGGALGLCLALSLLLAALPLASAAAQPRSPALVRPVSYGGLTIDVPSGWAVMTRAQDACGNAGPVALYGPPPPPVHQVCPLFRVLAVTVTLGGGDRVRPVGKETRHKIHGILTVESSRTVPGGGTELVARFPGRRVWFSANAPRPGAPPSSGGDITIVRRILGTVHRT
jgi:hypothetical protein